MILGHELWCRRGPHVVGLLGVLLAILILPVNAHAQGLNVALVCGTAACGDTNQDVPLRNHLTTTLGHTVTNFDDNDQTWTPTLYDVVVISESVGSSNAAWLKNQAVPIFTVEGANNDELEMGSGGSSSGGADTQINITDNSHYITSVFPLGVRTVTTVATNLGYMSGWANGVTKLAHYNSNSTLAKLLYVDAGGVLQGGVNTAAERRVFFAAQYFANLTADGVTLFNRSLDWAAYNTPTTQTGYAWSDDVASFTSKGDNVAVAFLPNTVYILGIQVSMESTVPTGDWVLQVREDGAGPWLDVLGLGVGESPVWQTYNIHTFAKTNGAVVLTTEFGNTSPPVGFTAVDGEFSDDNNGLTDGYSGANIYTELQYAIRAEPSAATHSYEFRVVYNGALLTGGYNILAQANPPPPCPPATLPFTDNFNRANSSTVGNCWVETESAGNDATINSNRLVFVTNNVDNFPRVQQNFTAVSTGFLRWTFVFDWARASAENFYSVFMQLGNSASFTAPPADGSSVAGAAINLRWGDDNFGFPAEEGFGYVQGITQTQVTTLTGLNTIEILTNLNNETFDLKVNGTTVASGIGFDKSLASIGGSIDAVRLYQGEGIASGAGGNKAFDDLTIETVSFAVSVTPDGADTLKQLPSNGTSYSYKFTVTNSSSVAEAFDLFSFPGDTLATFLTVDSITGPNVTGAPAVPDSARISSIAVSGSDSAFVWFSVANVAAGTLDSLYLRGRSVTDNAASDSGWVFIQLIKPNITTAKAVNPSGTQPPGTDLTYTVTITNDGSDDAVNAAIVDSLPVEVEFQVGSVVNNLPVGITVTVEYSNDGASTWTYTPVSAGCGAPTGYDGCVTHIRWTLQNNLSSIGPDNTGTVEFVARIQ